MYFFQNRPRRAARLASLLPVFLFACCGVAFADEGDDQYAAAARHYADQSWTEAATAFETFAKEFPQHPHALDAQFFSGEALLQLKHYVQARQRFSDFIQRAPKHAYTLQAKFRSAEALYLAGDAEAAARELAAFSEQSPQEALNAYALAYRAEIELNANAEA
jgi:TolA-binding protein